MKDIKNVYSVYFSPTGNTALVTVKLGKSLASRIGASHKSLDVTLPEKRKEKISFSEDDLVVFGTPTYAGRVPNKFLPFIKELFSGSSTLLIPLVTFGNRSYDSSLTELTYTLEDLGFVPIAAAAICCAHAFADIGKGRPDKNDTDMLKALSQKAADRIMSGEPVPDHCILPPSKREIAPYYIPLKEDKGPASFLKAKPVTDMRKCSDCGLCAQLCPMGSISFEDVSSVPGVCIKCQSCIKCCPQGAKYFTDPDFISHKKYLEKNHSDPKRSEFFL